MLVCPHKGVECLFDDLSSVAAGEAAIETGNAAAHGNTSYAIGVSLSFVELMTDAAPMLTAEGSFLSDLDKQASIP